MPIPGTFDDPKKKVTDDPGNLTPITITLGTVTGTGSAHVNADGSRTRSFIFTWTTSQPSSSLVRCGKNPNLDQVSAERDTGTLVTSHSLTFSVAYHTGDIFLYQVQSRYGGGRDGAGNSVMDGYAFTANGVFYPAP